MTPKEKAEELVRKMFSYQWRSDTIEFRNAKQCALIAVDEMITYLEVNGFSTQIYYWVEVKQEIEKL